MVFLFPRRCKLSGTLLILSVFILVLAGTVGCAVADSKKEQPTLGDRLESYVGKGVFLKGMEEANGGSLVGVYKDYFLIEITVRNPPSQPSKRTFSIPISRIMSLIEHPDSSDTALIIEVK
jgi:hypothetical protein